MLTWIRNLFAASPSPPLSPFTQSVIAACQSQDAARSLDDLIRAEMSHGKPVAAILGAMIDAMDPVTETLRRCDRAEKAFFLTLQRLRIGYYTEADVLAFSEQCGCRLTIRSDGVGGHTFRACQTPGTEHVDAVYGRLYRKAVNEVYFED